MKKDYSDSYLEREANRSVSLMLLEEAKQYANHPEETAYLEKRIDDIQKRRCYSTRDDVETIARLVEQDRINKDQLMKEENCAYSFYRNVLRCFIRLLPSIGCLSNTDYLIHKEKHKLKKQMNGK